MLFPKAIQPKQQSIPKNIKNLSTKADSNVGGKSEDDVSNNRISDSIAKSEEMNTTKSTKVIGNYYTLCWLPEEENYIG